MSVNFSVPDDVKEAFDRTFRDKNKSAVVADLMRRAVLEATRNKQREKLFRQLTDKRGQRASASYSDIRAARTAGRP